MEKEAKEERERQLKAERDARRKEEKALQEADRKKAAERMRADIERWIEDFPRATRFVEALYRDQRGQESS